MSAMDRVLSVLSQVMGVLTMLIPTKTPNHPPKHCACDILKTFWQSELAAVTVEQHWFKGMCHDVSL